MNKVDVLTRAKEILELGPLPDEWRGHGEYCPYCAIALAKSKLDDEHGTGLGFSESLAQTVYGIVETFEDLPLIEARESIGDIDPPFTKDGSLKAFNAAIKGE